MTTIAKSPVTRIAANVATFLFAVTIILQLLLAAGILPITMAWGGRQSVLTTSLRIASLVAVVVLGSFIYIIRRRAGLIGVEPPSTFNKIMAWLVTGFLALNTLGNLSSQSRLETIVFAPITVLLVVSCLVVSISRSDKRSQPEPDVAPSPEEIME
ncbi:MAG: hypothetical protein ACK2UH_16105 [Candidatus Promineifilaceae bacterium]